MSDPNFNDVLYLQHYEVDITSDVVGVDWVSSTVGDGTIAQSTVQSRYGTGSLNSTGSTSGNYAEITQSPSTLDVSQPFTIEFSVYATLDKSKGVFMHGGGTDNDRFQLYLRSDNGISVYSATGGVEIISISNTGTLTDDTWHDIALTYDGTTVTLYIDGVPSGTDTGFSSYVPTSTVFRWGWANQGGVAWSLNGYIDEMRITQIDRYGGLSYTPGPFADEAPPVLPLSITTQPQDTTVDEGQDATFTIVTSGGTGTVRYQWYDAFGFMAGERTSTLIVPSVVINNVYSCRVNDDLVGLLSNDAFLTVTPLPGTGPVIASDPQSINVDVGQPATFSVLAAGNGTLSYQWYQNAAPVGTNANTYTIASVTAGQNNDSIYVDVTDLDATVSSQSAVLQVYTATAYPANLPCPTWQYSEQSTAYQRRTLFASGWSRQRIQFAGFGTGVNLEFKMDTATLATWAAWAQDSGYNWFEIPLEDFSGVQQLREVRLTSAFQYAYGNFDTVIVSVQGEIKNG